MQSLSIDHLARGYTVLWGQLFLLHTSPWGQLPLFANIREWTSPTSPAALSAITLTAAVSLTAITIALRKTEHSGWHRYMLWLLWGILWVCIFSLPFSALSGRNPENRYVYIPSIGAATASAALFGGLYVLLAKRHLLRIIAAIAPVAILSYYAYVDASDLSEWTRAGKHTSSYLEAMQELVPEAEDSSHIFQVGVPGYIGTAYVFTTKDGFTSAVQLAYENPTLTAGFGEDRVRQFLSSDAYGYVDAHLFVYDAQTQSAQLVHWVEHCASDTECSLLPLAPQQRSKNAIPFEGSISLTRFAVENVYRLEKWDMETVLLTCWKLDVAANSDYVLFVHITDESGEETLAQADHRLQQSLRRRQPTRYTSHWPADEEICDIVALPIDTTEADRVVSIRGGLWVPENGENLSVLASPGAAIDQHGRLIFHPDIRASTLR